MRKRCWFSKVLPALLLALSLTGCGGAAADAGDGHVPEQGITIVEVLEDGIDAENAKRTGTDDTQTAGQLSESISQPDDSTKTTSENNGDVLQGVAADAPKPEVSEEMTNELNQMTATEGVDMDLTVLSATMVYTQVYDLMMYPQDHMGQIIRMDGEAACFYDEELDKYYYACIIQDATKCCAQGIEFELVDSYACPEDYPQDGDHVVITGRFDTYLEDGGMYAVLRDAQLIRAD